MSIAAHGPPAIAGHWDKRYLQAKDLIEQLNLKDRMTVVGPVKGDDLLALYNGAEIFVFPTKYERVGPRYAGSVQQPIEPARGGGGYRVVMQSTGIAQALKRLMDDSGLRLTLRQRALECAA